MLLKNVLCDAGKDWGLGLQEPTTPIQEGIIAFHNDLMCVMVFVSSFVSFILYRIIWNYEERRSTSRSERVHGTLIEVIWTVTPGLILCLVAVPSFTLLYAVDEVIEPGLTVKVIGKQWYWTYEYSDVDGEENGLEYDSYMLNEDDLEEGELRLLEVDNRLILPVETHVRLIVTASDVLHSFAVPSFGVKMDACPGRLNEVSLFVKREGVYYGQCSELCGVNHAFMPICVEVVSIPVYLEWISENLE